MRMMNSWSIRYRRFRNFVKNLRMNRVRLQREKGSTVRLLKRRRS